MSKRQQAPGDLELVRAFVNTVDIESEADELQSPESLSSWLARNRLSAPGEVVTRAELARAIELREALRAVLLSHNGDGVVPGDAARTLDAAVSRARVQLHFDPDGGPWLESGAAGVDGAVGRLLSIIPTAIAQGTWTRLKACREHTCEWAFYDHTKNRSGAWCNMAACGNRAKARAYRERRSAPDGESDLR